LPTEQRPGRGGRSKQVGKARSRERELPTRGGHWPGKEKQGGVRNGGARKYVGGKTKKVTILEDALPGVEDVKGGTGGEREKGMS